MAKTSNAQKECKVYKGYSIKSINRIQIDYPETEYIDIINKSTMIGLAPKDYIKLISKPCESCGGDTIVVKKLQHSIKQKTHKLSHVQIFIYINSDFHRNMCETKLLLNYKLRAAFQLPQESIVYTSSPNNRYNDKDCEAILTIFKNDSVHSITSVQIIKNQVYTI